MLQVAWAQLQGLARLGNRAASGNMAGDTGAIEVALQPGSRLNAYAVTLSAACLLIAFLTAILPFNSPAAVFLLDYGRGSLFEAIYPVTIQNILHLLTAVGIAELLIRWQAGTRERTVLALHLLPEDEQTLLTIEELGPLRRRVVPYLKSGTFLPALIDLAVLQLSTTRSVEQATLTTSNKLELVSHRLDLEYQLLRYVSWLIPTMGFIGTVVGISLSLRGLEFAGNAVTFDMGRVVAGLAISFNTTIMALMESAILVFLVNVTQRREELAMNAAADYCLTNLINRVYLKT
jgi:biopolymer transport protein ExbB/TolQ